MDKIKAFFKNKVTKTVCACAFVGGAVGLLIGGVTQESLSGTLVATVAAVTAVCGVIAIVSGLIGGKE